MPIGTTSPSMPPASAAAPTPADPARPERFAWLAGANLCAQAAEQLSLAAVPMVAVLLLSAGPRETGLLAAAQSLPFLLLALPFGLAADRFSRRNLMVAAEATRVVAMVLLGWLVWSAAAAAAPSAASSAASTLPSLGPSGTLFALAVLGFIGAVGTVAFSVAAPALVAQIVPSTALAHANGRLELARSLAFAGGPALAGALVAAAGGAAAFALAAALSAAAVVLLLRLPAAAAQRTQGLPGATPAPPSATGTPAPGSLRAELREGAAFVWHHHLLRPVLLTAVVWNLAWMVMQAVYVPHATQHLGLGAGGIGMTLSLYGLGMVLGAATAPRLMARLPLGAAIAVGPVVSVAAALAMAATLPAPQAWLAALSFFLFGAGPIVWTVSSTTLRQTLTPGAMLGRVSSIFLTANAGARPLGAALGAAIAFALADERHAIAACLWLSAAGFGLQALLVTRSPLMGLRSLHALRERASAGPEPRPTARGAWPGVDRARE